MILWFCLIIIGVKDVFILKGYWGFRYFALKGFFEYVVVFFFLVVIW